MPVRATSYPTIDVDVEQLMTNTNYSLANFNRRREQLPQIRRRRKKCCENVRPFNICYRSRRIHHCSNGIDESKQNRKTNSGIKKWRKKGFTICFDNNCFCYLRCPFSFLLFVYIIFFVHVLLLLHLIPWQLKMKKHWKRRCRHVVDSTSKSVLWCCLSKNHLSTEQYQFRDMAAHKISEHLG